jgi:c-di-GMP-binding flagellar brake protein YcgR
MTLTALLVCVDKAAAEVLQQVLKELRIEVEFCPEFVRAAIRLAQQRFDVLIVDGESNADVMSLLRETRLSRMNDSTLAVAVVSGQESIREMFSLGVNFVVYKPVAHDRALSSLRAARAVMRKEKRKSARATVHAQATVDYANVQQEKATLIDLAQDGMSMRFGKKLPPTSKVYFQFKLPGQTSAIRLSGQVVWQDWNGRAGVQFIDVPKASRKLLSDFLAANLPTEVSLEGDGGKERPEITMEIDESQLATVSVGEQTHGTNPNHGTAEKAAQAEAQPANEPNVLGSVTDNRRTQNRYACRLGAEVYRTGISVPIRCCLTDLSAGGCYLEFSQALPSGSSAEIVVRTYDMKLHLRGTVQGSHPGYGMGIAFELKTNEQRANVKKLLDFVASTTQPS